jgi:hypothetical protein
MLPDRNMGPDPYPSGKVLACVEVENKQGACRRASKSLLLSMKAGMVVSMKSIFSLLSCAFVAGVLQAAQWVEYQPPSGMANGRHIVMLSGDEEYRSEESLPQLGKILSQRHGFRCTVLFSQDEDGTINPNNQTHVPGMHLLAGADLVINQFRFRELPDADMRHFVDYLESGKPMIVVRTATHAFSYERNKQSPYARFDWRAPGGGFGGMTVGESWTYHHGQHGGEATRGLVDGPNRKHPILNQVFDVFGPSDVYGVNADFPQDARVLLHGATLTGMSPSDPVNLRKSLAPIVWLREVEMKPGVRSMILSSTIGAAIDMASEDLRRLFINACYHMTGLEVPARASAEVVGEFNPSMFGFNTYRKGVKVSDHALRP